MNRIGKRMRAALELSFCHGGDGLAIAGRGKCVSRSRRWETFGVSGGDVRCAGDEALKEFMSMCVYVRCRARRLP
jgi:hypothetical protein